MNVAELIEGHEDRREIPYLDSEEIITWGVGRNVQQVSFSADELALANQLIDLMFENDLRACRKDLLESFSWFNHLDEVRQAAVTDLRFNLGPNRLRGFKKFLAAMARSDWPTAAVELENSKWFTQVGRRGPRIVSMIKRGEWP